METLRAALYQDDLHHAAILAASTAAEPSVLMAAVDRLTAGLAGTAAGMGGGGLGEGEGRSGWGVSGNEARSGGGAEGAGVGTGAGAGEGREAYRTDAAAEGREARDDGDGDADVDDDFSDSSSIVDQAVLCVTGGVTPVMVLLRSRQGLRGLQALQFNSPNVMYM